MSLKKQIVEDVERIFLNHDEFADTHVFEGKRIVAIVDDEQSLLNTISSDGFQNISGIGLLNCDRLVYCSVKDIHSLPVPGQKISMDGFFWIVADKVIVEMGLIIIPLNRVY